MEARANERCSWCGEPVEEAEGFRAYEPAGERRAVFCRLEHLVPWAMQGPHWEAGGLSGSDSEERPAECSLCGSGLGDVYFLLVHHRGEHRVSDAFCSLEHMREWANRGGRWA
jgi:hypothetical protein